VEELDGLSPDMLRLFGVLRKRFLSGLDLRRRQIRELEDKRCRIDALHRLTGAAGSFGFLDIGHTARCAEQCLVRALGDPWDSTAMADFADALRALEALVDETLRAHHPGEGVQVQLRHHSITLAADRVVQIRSTSTAG
jgi:HPt (histidine-containing phosphotransfer) domain-containing protein